MFVLTLPTYFDQCSSSLINHRRVSSVDRNPYSLISRARYRRSKLQSSNLTRGWTRGKEHVVSTGGSGRVRGRGDGDRGC